MKILFVEDEPAISNFVSKGLRTFHHVVDVAHDGGEGLYLAKTNPYDLFIFDISMPVMDGLELTRQLREHGVKNKTKPILLLTAKDDTQTKVAALDSGADDYLTKPFSFEELLARIRALSRREIVSSGKAGGSVLTYEDIEMDLPKRIVKRAGREVALGKKEFALLEYFLRNPEMVLTRTMLLEQVWDMNTDPFTNTIDVHIRFLRKALGCAGADQLIHTQHGVGYKLEKLKGAAARAHAQNYVRPSALRPILVKVGGADGASAESDSGAPRPYHKNRAAKVAAAEFAARAVAKKRHAVAAKKRGAAGVSRRARSRVKKKS